ncbi:hypothetical protein SAMN04488515_0866 [Cognatiyoonia koreensis]|uniref:Uncharacterized protein n=1 Tax=Cognatiyoonia koreensis TaxID=364200 RepID=A0A1I0NWF1_9RHOB|nr:hypothetical protein [Cognatiyoonia koreensis]SEW06120.1 hypothetical protein SAMN04488515_0866 [Cognatiyoonia koreensis]
MKDTYIIESPTTSVFVRIPLLIIGVLFFGIGFFAFAKTVLAMIQNLFGASITGDFGLGLLIGVGFMVMGAFPAYRSIEPAKTLCFDAAAKEVRLVLRYPFGLKRRYTASFDEKMLPKPVWIVDTDSISKGYWALEAVLPDGNVMHRLDRQHHPQMQQKATVEQWCDDIARLMT